MVRRLGQRRRRGAACRLKTRLVIARNVRSGVFNRRDERTGMEVGAATSGNLGKRQHRPDAALRNEQQAKQHPQNSRPDLQRSPPSHYPGEYRRGLQASG